MRLSRLFHPKRPIFHEIVAKAYAASITTPIRTRAHGLSLPLIVSLTSYPPRFPTLVYTLQALLLQETRPDAIQLYVAHKDKLLLPAPVRALGGAGVTILLTDDIGPYKKYIPARRAHPEAVIVTVDDDVYVAPSWLGDLIGEWVPGEHMVLSNRAHRVVTDPGGMPVPSRKWQHDIADTMPGWDVAPAGGAGTLYPPGIHHSDLCDVDRFMSLCPGTDDIWLYWMALCAGASLRKVGKPYDLVTWSGSQRHALWRTNFKGGNDRAVAAMVNAYGPPEAVSLASARNS